MCDQQIETVSNKLVQFIQDLTANIQTIFNHQNLIELLCLRSDYARQLAALFDMLINKFIDEFVRNRTIEISLNLDPVHIWRLIQCCIDQLNDMQWQELDTIIKHIRTINKYFYNLLSQIKNVEFLNIDQIRTLNQNFIEELNHLAESLIHLTTINIPQKPTDTYLFQGVSTTQYSNNNNHLTDSILNSPSTETPAMNSNCFPCNMTNNLSFQPNPIHCTTGTIPTANIFQNVKPMGFSNNPGIGDTPTPVCSPTPVVYTPEMETLFSSGGIIYARKSGNTWIAENLGTLVETLKDIGQTIDMDAHSEILVRKTGELYVRRKRGRRKRILQQTFNKKTSRRNDINHQQTDSNISNDDDDD